MPSYARPNKVGYTSLVLLAPAVVAGAVLLDGSPAAAASCPTGDPPCITSLESRQSSDGKFLLVVHFSASCHYDVFHLQLNRADWSPKEWSRSRSALCNNQTQTFLITGNTQGSSITARIQGCVKYVIGKDRCTPFSPPETIVLDSPRHIQACRNYASRAVGTVRLARFTYRCDPKVISGPRWSSNFDEHFRWCQTADPQTANFEDRERGRIAQECRISAAGPKGGTPRITVTSRGGDTFFINGSGFPPNSPIIIRLSGPGASIATVTVANNERIVSNKDGNISIRLFGAQICKRGGGRIDFSAEDQDRPQKATGSATCAP